MASSTATQTPAHATFTLTRHECRRRTGGVCGGLWTLGYTLLCVVLPNCTGLFCVITSVVAVVCGFVLCVWLSLLFLEPRKNTERVKF